MHNHNVHIYTCAHTCTTGKTTHRFIHSLTHANSHMHAHERTNKHTHTLSYLWKSFVKSIWMWNGEGSESEVHREAEASELDFGVCLSPCLMVLSGGRGSISVTSGLSPLLRDGEIWQIGNLERTNRYDPLSPSRISSLGATRGHELRSYQRAGPGGRLPWSRPPWKEFSLGKFICSQMQAASSISASERSGSLLLYRFVPALAQVRQERRILSFGIPNRIIHHLSALTVSLQIPTRKGGWENHLLLSTSVSTSCLWCIPVRHPCKYLSCVFIYDTSMIYDSYMMLFSFPRA